MRFRQRQRQLIIIALAFTSFLLPAPAAIPADEPFTIPVILSLTGSAAFLGKSEAQGLQILEKTLNAPGGGIGGRPVHFDIQDDQTSPQVAVQLNNALLAKHAPIVLGSDIVSICNAMQPLTKENAVIYCFSPGAHPDAGSYMFSAGVGGADIYAAFAQYMLDAKLYRVGAIWSTDVTGQDGERNMTELLTVPKNKPLQIVANEHFNPADLSVAAQMSHLVNANAQVCVCWTTGAALGTLIRAYTEAGLTVPFVTSTGNMTYAQMTAYANYNNKALYFIGFPYFGRDQLRPGPMRSAIDTFLRAYNDAGIKPDSAPGYVWDAGLITVAAFRKFGAGATAAQIHDYITHLRGFAGIDGMYDFVAVPQRGVGKASAVLTRWDPAKATWVMVN
jgi:branched-chain amino acid transport system substrate-binding protein